MRGRASWTTASASSSETVAGRPPRVDRRPRSSPRSSTGSRSRRSCAGRAARRRSGASGRPRAAGAGTSPRRARGRGCPGRGRRCAGPAGCASRSSAPARARRTAAPRGRRGGCAATPSAASAATAPPTVDDLPGAGHAQVRVDRQPALEAQEQVLAVGVDGAHGAARQPLGPAVARRSAGAAWPSSSGTWPSSTGRIRLARVVDRVALGHRLRRQRELARAGAEAELDQRLLVGRADDRLAVDALERERA